MKATLWFTVCNFLVKGISFIAVPIFTYIMSADEYGLSALYMSYQEIVLILATWELYIGAYQRGLFKYQDGQDAFTLSTVLFINLITAACLIIFLAFSSSLTAFTKVPLGIWLIFFVYYLFFPAYNCWMVEKRKTYEYKPVVAATLLYSLISAGSPIAALVFLEPTAPVKIAFTLLPAALFCFPFYVRCFRAARFSRLTLSEMKNQWLFLVRYQGPLVMHSLAYYVLNQSDILMISYLIGDAETAYYSVAYSVAMAISLLQNSVNLTLVPWRYEMLQKGMFARIRSSTTSLLTIIGLVIVAFILVAPELIALLFGSKYQLAIWCIPPIALSAYFIFLYSVFVNIETYYEATKYVMYVSVFCALLNIALNFVGIHYLGFVGCAFATLLSYIAFAVGHFFFAQSVLLKKGIPICDVVAIRPVTLLSVGFIASMLIALVVYPVPVIRYAVLTALIVAAVLNRKRIQSVLSGLKDIRS